jgi:hypothetical protein
MFIIRILVRVPAVGKYHVQVTSYSMHAAAGIKSALVHFEYKYLNTEYIFGGAEDRGHSAGRGFLALLLESLNQKTLVLVGLLCFVGTWRVPHYDMLYVCVY